MLIWYIVVPAIAYLIALICIGAEDQEWAAGMIFAIPVAAFAWLAVFACHQLDLSDDTNYHTTYTLHEMQLKNEGEGHSTSSFFLIAGGSTSSFTKHGYYYFYAETPNGDITIGKMRMEDAVIRQGDYKPVLKCKTHKKNEHYTDDSYNVNHCIFYVPEGSIGDKIDIHLKGNV